MKRSNWVTSVTLAQLLLSLTLAGVTVYLLVLARSPEIQNLKDAAGAAYGLRIAAGLGAPLALICLASVYGLWRDKRWGWWLGFLLNLIMAVTLVYGVMDDGWSGSDAEDIAMPVVLVVLLVLFVVPAVRRHYWGRSDARPDAAALASNR
jgi:uncharacterized membrane protein (DUF2068 family)